MNVLKPLVLPDEPDDLEQIAEENEEEAQSKEGENKEEEKKEGDPEPKIEDVIDSSSKPAPVEATK